MDPRGDRDVVETELMLKDLEQIERDATRLIAELEARRIPLVRPAWRSMGGAPLQSTAGRPALRGLMLRPT